MANKIICTCGHSWNKSDSSKKDAYVCHICGKDIKNMQLGGNVYSASYVPQAEEGWLSKYEDGGSMQEHQENYNDSSVSMGPGFVGMGNNTKGRNYSPAWGGQFEDGGYIPQAQNGLEKNEDVESSAYEKEGAPSRLPSIKSTFASYINSPIYKKRLEGMNVANPDKVIKERLNKLNQVDVSVGPSPSLIYAYTKPNQKEQVPALTVKQKDSDYTMMHELSHVTNYGDTFFDPKINKYAKSNFGDVNTASGKGMSVNEMLYITDRANMSPKYKNAILAKAESNKKWGTYSNPADGSGLAGDPHAFDSSELKSDLDAIRLLFQREKLTKKFGEDIDESTIEKALKNKNISNEPHFKRMLKNFNKKNIVDLNNRIAMNNLKGSSSDNMAEYGGAFAMGGSMPGAVGFTYARTKGIPSEGPYAKKTMPSAQNGQEMKFYQEGLDWKPRNISKQGSKIKKDDMGYWNSDNWGKPVEIGSNNITMQGVNQPLIGISDTGDTKMMYPGEDYKFKGKKVTEYPVAQNGKSLPTPYFKSTDERDAYRNRLKEVSERVLSNQGSDENLLLNTSYHDINTGNNCINGICGLNLEAGLKYNKPTDNDRFLSGEKFAQAVAKGDEDYYQVDGNFQVGDMLQYRKKRGSASHNKMIYDSFVNDAGEKMYKIIDNSGGKTMKTDTYTEAELKKMQLEGGGGYNKVNIYRPGYNVDKELIAKEREASTSPETRKALASRKEKVDWETSRNPGYKYSIREDSPYYGDQPEGMQKFVEFANDDKKINKLVEKLGVDKGIIHDELLNTFGELGQENKWEDRLFGGTGGIENTIETIFKPKSWSIGPGQIKFNTIDPELKEKFDIKKPKDLYNFDKIIPLMTAINVKNRKWMENKGEALSEKLIGKPGVDASELDGGVGRWTPYMYRGSLTNPVNSANAELAGTDLYGQELTNERNRIIREKASLFDKGSYASNVFENINKNLERTLPGEYFEIPQEMQPITVTAKKKKNGGWLDKYK